MIDFSGTRSWGRFVTCRFIQAGYKPAPRASFVAILVSFRNRDCHNVPETSEAAMNPAHPDLADLFSRYLEHQAAAHAEGLGIAEDGEVALYDAVPVQPVEPRLAWTEALAALKYLAPSTDFPSLAVPPEWSSLVAAHEPETTLPFCLGNFPQLVRHLPALLRPARPEAPTANPAPEGVLNWANEAAAAGSFPLTLLAASLPRLARDFDAAERFLPAESAVPPEWRAAWANEKAALLWQRGHFEQAAALWRSQKESVPVLFNRGMAALFLGDAVEARTCLTRATSLLGEEDAWHHLGRLYLALAEMRG
jgi:tetratricopeptide (TPR) repeat protein